MVDDSTDSGTHEQRILSVRYVNVRLQSVVTHFLGLKRIEGHPNAETLYSAIMSVVGSEGSGLCLPTDRLVCITTDGASVMSSPRNNVLGKLRNRIGNAKLLNIAVLIGWYLHQRLVSVCYLTVLRERLQQPLITSKEVLAGETNFKCSCS